MSQEHLYLGQGPRTGARMTQGQDGLSALLRRDGRPTKSEELLVPSPFKVYAAAPSTGPQNTLGDSWLYSSMASHEEGAK